MNSNENTINDKNANPLAGLDEWEEDVLRRYPDAETMQQQRQQRNSEIMMHLSGIPFANFID
jgi:hypothetical protein